VGEFRYCPNCGAEYRSGFDRCSDCLVELVDDPPPFKQAPPAWEGEGDPEYDPDVHVVEVYRTDRLDAEFVRTFLESNGIPAITSGEGYSSAYPMNVGAFGQRQVLVREDDAEDARDLIDRANAARDPATLGVPERISDRPRLGGMPALLMVVIAIIFVMAILAGLVPIGVD
jgi:hypothetical protein